MSTETERLYTQTACLTGEEIQAFRKAAMPLMEWLHFNCHPHVTAIVDSEHVELMEGLAATRREPLK